MQDISALIGPPRLYHCIVLLLSFVRAFPNSWTTFAGPFVAPDVDHWCSKPDLPFLVNWTEQQWKERALPVADKSGGAGDEKYESCKMFPIISDGGNGTDVSFDNSTTVPCNTWTYNESFPGSSAVPEWDLVCQHEWQRSMMTSVVFIGQLIGSPIMGHLSDRFGRRTVLLGCTLGTALLGAISAASPSVKWYNALRFFTSIITTGIIASSVTLLTEILDPRYRTLLNLPYTAGFALPTLLLPGVAYLLGNWKLLQLVCGLSALACLPFLLVVQESPRWLITMGREEEAKRAIRKILRMNHRTVSNVPALIHGLVVRIQESSAKALGPLEILKNGTTRKTSILLSVMWICDTFVMYSVILGAVHIEGSPQFNFAISTAIEIPAAFVGLALVFYFRRRPSQTATSLLLGISAAAALLPPPGIPYVGLALTMAGRLFLILSGSVRWVWTMELYPTAARGFGFSACFTIGRMGGVLSPFMNLIKKQSSVYIASALLASAGIVSATMAAFIPETLGVELPDTFQDAEDIIKKNARKEGITLVPVATYEEVDVLRPPQNCLEFSRFNA